jgi:hypothetical protein
MSELYIEETTPTQRQVQLIYKDTYNFFTKYACVENIDHAAMIDEVRNIERQYPFELCRKLLVENVAILDGYYRENLKVKDGG